MRKRVPARIVDKYVVIRDGIRQTLSDERGALMLWENASVCYCAVWKQQKNLATCSCRKKIFFNIIDSTVLDAVTVLHVK